MTVTVTNFEGEHVEFGHSFSPMTRAYEKNLYNRGYYCPRVVRLGFTSGIRSIGQ